MSHKKVHFAFGAYGIISASNKLLVISKNGGPYIKRYDLPGGSLDEGESISEAVVREVREETGLETLHFQQLGTISFIYPWTYQHFNWNNHVCTFYLIDDYSGTPRIKNEQFIGQDANGSEWVDIEDLNLENSSPLVLKAKEYLLLKKFVATDTKYTHWNVLH
ncbi:NUDIX hydrolase [Companilactobacillus heilongjiangensis]|uniref:NUDIX hydrolase n=1 Tax=Companilactobacillus heilongjiangensis TaxID=1074467 RepID=A0A0K2LA12_9LACO|nr:NUDIX hydrolase [Companilactobacillus heilongjiangensis]ALB28126.1 NUDIX hydrolase [Companilactobacillus heilongjiangensis]